MFVKGSIRFVTNKRSITTLSSKEDKTVVCRKGFLVVIVLLFALGVVLSGCGETVEPTRVDRDAQGERETPRTQTFAIGDTVAMGDLVITLNSARWVAGDEFYKPKPGERWLALDCTIENLANESVAISSMLMFKLYDEEAFSRNQEYFADVKGSLDGELGPGRKMRGEVVFNVEEGQTAWEFIFEPQVFGFGQAIFEITEDDVE
jgi:hypothetical protein